MFKQPVAEKANAMSASDYVAQAARWAHFLAEREARGPGDFKTAIQRVASRIKVGHSVLWRLRYRRPKDLAVSAYFKLRDAYEHECARQMRLLEHEIEITKATTPRSDSVGASEALVRAERLRDSK